jgi:putative RNA 2'-phosphotransferase
MDARTLVELSKFLSWVLRHRPDAIGIALDAAGWTDVEALLARARAHGRPLTRELLERIVAESPKQRFALSEDGRRIRASQGHSVEVQLGYEPATPPEVLFHGSVAANRAAIRADGLRKMNRHYVHLSPDEASARSVGGRRGKPVMLRVAAGRMHRNGHVFFRSANGVWLTDHVPPEYIEFPQA